MVIKVLLGIFIFVLGASLGIAFFVISYTDREIGDLIFRKDASGGHGVFIKITKPQKLRDVRTMSTAVLRVVDEIEEEFDIFNSEEGGE